MAMITKSGIRYCLDGPVGTRQVELPNGRKIDLASREGADDFVDTVGTDFISANLTAANDNELTLAYTLMHTVSEKASPEKIAAGFPESELRTFVEHTRDTLKTLSTDRNWLRSGTVLMCHEILLKTVASFSRHPSFFKIFFSNEGMEIVAKFYASRKKHDTPNRTVALSILRLVNNTLSVNTQDGANPSANLEKTFVMIEKTGLLGQFIRCVPVDPECSADMLKCLQAGLPLVKKKLKSGTPTGDILDAVIAGKDGPITEKAKAGLAKLQSLARLSNNNDTKSIKICRHCKKIETRDGRKLMKCQRCKVAYYCNKECQAADWKSHKKLCKELGSANKEHSAFNTSNTTMWAFVESNYFAIAKEVYKKTQEYNVTKKELFLEIDFYGDAPGLRNEFKVWLTSDFFEESALVDAPEWFRTDTDKKTLTPFLRTESERVTSDDLLVVCRFGNGMKTAQVLQFPQANTGCQYLSDEAVESIGREDYVRMVACLGQAVTNMYFEKRRGLK
jgi:uncharacterized C2H2 Zn-finger protein